MGHERLAAFTGALVSGVRNDSASQRRIRLVLALVVRAAVQRGESMTRLPRDLSLGLRTLMTATAMLVPMQSVASLEACEDACVYIEAAVKRHRMLNETEERIAKSCLEVKLEVNMRAEGARRARLGAAGFSEEGSIGVSVEKRVAAQEKQRREAFLRCTRALDSEEQTPKKQDASAAR